MLVYVKDRSMRAKRRKGRYIKRKPPEVVKYGHQHKEPYRASDHRDLPSHLDKRCRNNLWLSVSEMEAQMILDRIINGEMP